jgi:hypothetical protein
MPRAPALDIDLSIRVPTRPTEAAARLQLDLLEAQTRLRDLRGRRAVPVAVHVFEGMDAASKGGAIRRLTVPRPARLSCGPSGRRRMRSEHLAGPAREMPARTAGS